MKKILVAGLALVLLGTAAWWWLRSPRSPPADAFDRLHGDFIVAWQANGVSLRRCILVRQALARAAEAKVPADYLDRLRSADWISGVVLPNGKTEMAIQGYNVPFVTIAGHRSARTQIGQLEPLPWGKDIWLVVDPRSPGPLTLSPFDGITVQFPSELFRTARPIIAYGTVGLLSLEFAAEAEYASQEDAERLASTLRGFLGLVRNLTNRNRNATADQALKLFWESLEVKTDGPRLLVRVRLDEMGLARLVPAVRPPKSGL